MLRPEVFPIDRPHIIMRFIPVPVVSMLSIYLLMIYDRICYRHVDV